MQELLSCMQQGQKYRLVQKRRLHRQRSCITNATYYFSNLVRGTEACMSVHHTLPVFPMFPTVTVGEARETCTFSQKLPVIFRSVQ